MDIDQDKQRTTWLFRKKRDLGNFSIEQSFREVANAWPEKPTPKLIEATHFSEGWRSRWKIIRQARAIKTDILHITGDIHFRGARLAKMAKKPSPGDSYHSRHWIRSRAYGLEAMADEKDLDHMAAAMCGSAHHRF